MLIAAFRAAAVSALVAAIFFAALVAAALWIPQDGPTIRRHVVAAVLEGVFNKHFSYGPFGDIGAPRQTMDCLLADMMLAPPASRIVEAMSNRYAAPQAGWNDPRVGPAFDCQALARAIPELGPGYGDVQWLPYDRYIMAPRIVGRVMLSAMPYETMLNVLRVASYALIAAIGLLAFYRLSRVNPDPESRLVPAGYLTIALCLVLLYGVHYFDATLYFATQDMTNYAFIMISMLMPLASSSDRRLVLYGACYGSLIAIFEIFTGGIPFAIAILPLLLALGFRGDMRAYFAKLLLLWTSFCIAVLASFAIKKGFTIAFLGDRESFLDTLLYRMHGDLPALAEGRERSLSSFFKLYRHWSNLLAFGSRNIGIGLVAASFGVLIAWTWRTRNAGWSGDRALLIACWLGVAALIAWFSVFFSHAIIHPYVMARLFAVPVMAATVLIVIGLVRRRQPRVLAEA